MSLHCSCPSWEPEIKKLNGPLALESVRSGGAYNYDGKPFTFCPWCGERLLEKCDECGAYLLPGEKAEGHYFFGGCQRPTVEAPEFDGRCRECGTPIFGTICTKCNGEAA